MRDELTDESRSGTPRVRYEIRGRRRYLFALVPLKEIVYLRIDNRFDEILFVFSLLESDVSPEGFGDHFRIVDEGILFVDSTAIATSAFFRCDEVVGLSFIHIP